MEENEIDGHGLKSGMRAFIPAESNLRIHNTDQAPILQFAHLRRHERIRHAVFTRHGGFSRGRFASLNVSYGVGDPPASVHRNRDKMRRILNTPALAFARQVHGTGVRVVSANNLGGFCGPRPPTADALVTDMKGVFVGIQVADCQPVLLWDPVRKAVANVHSGWRGSIRNIVGHTVAVMQERLGSKPADMIAAIGPSLGPCCSEFVNYRQEIPKRFWRYKDSADRFDFWAVTRDQLQTAGLDPANIACSHICTRCNTDQFFSYRGEGVTGRFAAVIGLR